MEFDEYFKQLKGKEVAIAGFGVSNRPCVNILLSHGANVTVYDKKNVDQLGEEAAIAREKGARFVSGEDYLDKLDGDLILRSPGMHPKLFAGKAGKLTSETELFFELAPCITIGITGSDGKSTTTTLTSKILEKAGYHVHMGGNIGIPLLPKLPEMQKSDIAVLELSSFQLMTFSRSPDRAAITNISPNHLDIHADMNEYIEAKKNIYSHQKPSSTLVINLDNRITAPLRANAGSRTVGFTLEGAEADIERVRFENETIYYEDEEIIRDSDILLPGRHNVANYMTAIALTHGLAGRDAVRHTANNFPGVEHRLELVRVRNGVRYYNSSIDSSPTRTNAALSVFKEPVIAILGGYDKHIPFEPLHDPVNAHCPAVVLMGATAEMISQAIGGELPRLFAKDMAEAVSKATSLAEETGSKIVILSPACASFDLYSNFVERGNCFRSEVNAL